MTWNEGVKVLEIAWQNIPQFDPRNDCSHLVNEIYEVAGLHYAYATSNELYSGVHRFKRVATPQPADLIVWPGHVGIVVDPREHSFYSAVSSGFKLDSYDSPVWRARGRPRFFRFLISEGEHVRTASGRNVTIARAGQSPADDSASDLPVAPIAPAEARASTSTAAQPSDETFINWDRNNKAATEEGLLRAWSNTSDERQDRWEQADEIVIVDSLKIQRIHFTGSTGVLEAKVKSAGSFTPDGVQVHSSTEAVTFHLVQDENGWRIDNRSGRIYLSGNAAVVAISERLAAMAREGSSRAEQAQAAALLHAMLH